MSWTYGWATMASSLVFPNHPFTWVISRAIKSRAYYSFILPRWALLFEVEGFILRHDKVQKDVLEEVFIYNLIIYVEVPEISQVQIPYLSSPIAILGRCKGLSSDASAPAWTCIPTGISFNIRQPHDTMAKVFAELAMWPKNAAIVCNVLYLLCKIWLLIYLAPSFFCDAEMVCYCIGEVYSFLKLHANLRCSCHLSRSMQCLANERLLFSRNPAWIRMMLGVAPWPATLSAGEGALVFVGNQRDTFSRVLLWDALIRRFQLVLSTCDENFVLKHFNMVVRGQNMQ